MTPRRISLRRTTCAVCGGRAYWSNPFEADIAEREGTKPLFGYWVHTGRLARPHEVVPAEEEASRWPADVLGEEDGSG